MADKRTILLDTSVLVPALIEQLPQHGAAAPLVREAIRNDVRLVVAAHALAECYATLTALPLSPRLSSGQAKHLLRHSITNHATVVPLDEDDYASVLDRAADLDLRGGAIYDLLHVRAAERAEADALYTFNGRDFRRMPPSPPTALIVL